MRKLFSVLALSMACATLAACAPKGKTVDKEKVWSQNVYEKICAFGSNQVEVNNEDVDNDWGVKDYNEMTAISLGQLEQISADVEKKLEDRDLLGLYKFEGLVLGHKDAGWEAYYKTVDGEKAKLNGSYAFKACGVDKNADDEWVKTCHFSSPESHGENLTPSAFFLTDNMTSTKIDGFDHDSNPVAYQAGKYTFILALYKTGVGANNITCGLGLIKTAERTPYVPPESYPVTSAKLGGVNGDWDNGVAMTLANGVFTATFTAAAAGEFKVKLNGEWTFSLGAHALEAKEYQDNDGNIAYEAGTYLVTLKLGANAMANFRADKTISIFTVAPANQ